MSIKILHKGLSDSIQDHGRYGYQHLGIQTNGCIDLLSASLANYILQNDTNAPVIELHFPSSEITFLDEHIICISGANFVPVLNEKSVSLNKPIAVCKNDVLTMLQPLEGTIAYVAIKGNYNEPSWLHSYSYYNKRLDKGDIIHFSAQHLAKNKLIKNYNEDEYNPIVEKIQSHLFSNINPIKILPGPAWQDLQSDSLNDLLNTPFTISTQRNRMGYALTGAKLNLTIPNAYLSSAVTRGTLQLLPNGNIIVLMADHQTIGGYANLGQIILVDLPRFAQMKSGQTLKFTTTNLEEAQTLYQKMYAPFKY
jgi:antagonist of KipI